MKLDTGRPGSGILRGKLAALNLVARLDVEEVDDPACETPGVLEAGPVAGVRQQPQLSEGRCWYRW
jgi:hypothetical protein